MMKKTSFASFMVLRAAISLASPVAVAPNLSTEQVPEPPPTRVLRVLLVHSYHQGFSWTDEQDRGLASALRERFPPASLELSRFYLDERRRPDLAASTQEYFERLYADRDLDLLIATDNIAFERFKASGWRLRRGLPMVFCGVNNFSPGQIADLPSITGAAENFLSGRADTIATAVSLHPGARAILFILDSTTTSAAIREEIEAIASGFPDLSFRFAVEDRLERQLALVSAVDPRDIVIPIGVHYDSAGALLDYESSMERLSAACPAPCFGFIENRIGHGIVGGKILTGFDHGRLAGNMAATILAGTPAGALSPVLDNPGALQFDFRQLRRFGIPESDLPPSAQVLFRPADAWALYSGYIAAGGAAVAFLAAVSILLAASRARLKKAQDRLKRDEALLQSYIEGSPDGIVVADAGWRCLRANRSAAFMTGYSKEELQERAFTDLLDPSETERGRSCLGAFGANDTLYGEFMFRKKDGSPLHMSVHAAGLGDEKLAICHDIGGRIAAENETKRSLREKETLLRELYHRTKNNMHVVCSLLSLYEPELADSCARRVFREMADRIRAMALVHEKLYRSSDLSRVAMDEYFRDLAAISAGSSAHPPSLHLELEEIRLPVDKAVPLGLVVNELIANCTRHAFADGSRAGVLRLALSRSWGKGIIVELSDDGPGFPAGFDPRASGKMGLQTVLTLVQDQLGGTIEWSSGRGVAYRISIGEEAAACAGTPA